MSTYKFEKEEFDQKISMSIPDNETDPPGFGLLFYTVDDKDVRIETSLSEVLEQTQEVLAGSYDNWGRAYARMLRDAIAALTKEYEKEMKLGGWDQTDLDEAYAKISEPPIQ